MNWLHSVMVLKHPIGKYYSRVSQRFVVKKKTNIGIGANISFCPCYDVYYDTIYVLPETSVYGNKARCSLVLLLVDCSQLCQQLNVNIIFHHRSLCMHL